MKVGAMIALLLSLMVRAEVYMYEWDERAESEKISEAMAIALAHGIDLTPPLGVIQVKQQLAQELLATGAYHYFEIDKALQQPMDHEEPSAKSFATIVNESNRAWNLELMNVHEAWETTQGDPTIVVAFCDSGVDAALSELRGKILPGWNFIADNSNTEPYRRSGRANHHGTSVASFVAASPDPVTGLSGVAPNISLLPGLISNAKGRTTSSRIRDCIRWASDKGARVINVSMSGSTTTSAWRAAQYAYSKNSLVVWSSGNDNNYNSSSDREEILVVGGTDIDNSRYQSGRRYGSNYGPYVDIVAPGEAIYKPWGSHRRTNGTSYSAPMVSGVAALLLSKNPSLSVKSLIRILKSSALNLGNSDEFGAGLVNAKAAIDSID